MRIADLDRWACGAIGAALLVLGASHAVAAASGTCFAQGQNKSGEGATVGLQCIAPDCEEGQTCNPLNLGSFTFWFPGLLPWVPPGYITINYYYCACPGGAEQPCCHVVQLSPLNPNDPFIARGVCTDPPCPTWSGTCQEVVVGTPGGPSGEWSLAECEPAQGGGGD